MTLFWILAALMVAVALALILIPLLRGGGGEDVDAGALNVALHRDRLAELEADLADGTVTQEEYAQAKEELERDLLQDVTAAGGVSAGSRGGLWMAAVAAVLVPAISVALYLGVGEPGALDGSKARATAAGAADIQQMVRNLEQRLEKQSNDVEGWMMLGRSYSVLNRIADAVTAYRKAVELQPQNIEAILFLAESIANTQGGDISRGEPPRLIAQARAIDPNQPTAMWMEGIVRYQQGDYRGAIELWERVLPTQNPEGEGYRMISEALADARRQAGMAPPPAAAATEAAPAGAEQASSAQPVAGPKLLVSVGISDEMALQAQVEDTLFIYARAAQGPKAPLAMVKRQVGDLPLTVTLDNSMAMVPGMDLTAFPEVVVYARVSKSGTAAAAEGDLVGTSDPVRPAESGTAVAVNIDRPL